MIGVGPAVCGVVQGFGSSAVAGAHLGSFHDELRGEYWLIRRRSHVTGRVTGVDLVADRTKEVRLAISAARSDTNRTVRQTWRRAQATRCLSLVT